MFFCLGLAHSSQYGGGKCHLVVKFNIVLCEVLFFPLWFRTIKSGCKGILPPSGASP